MIENNLMFLFKQFIGRKPRTYDSLVELGKRGFVETRNSIMIAYNTLAVKMIMVGDAADKLHHTYRIYNPTTKYFLDISDVQWVE